MRSLAAGLAIATVFATGASVVFAQGGEPAEPAPAAAAPAPAEAAAAPSDAAETPAPRRRHHRKVAAAAVEADDKPVNKSRRARRLALLKAAEEERAAQEAAAVGRQAPAAEHAVATPLSPSPSPSPAAVDAGAVDSGLDGVHALDALPAVAAAHEAPVHEIHAAGSAEPAHGEGHGKAAGEHAEAGEHGGEHPQFKVGTFVLQLINFAGLLFLLIYFGGRAFNKSLRSRHEQLKTEVMEAARLRDEAQQKAAAQDKRLATLENEIAALRATMREEAAREQTRLLDGAQERAKRIQDDMRFQIDQQVKEAEMLLRAEVASAAVKLAEELAGKAVDTQDERRLAQEFVAGFGGPAGGQR